MSTSTHVELAARLEERFELLSPQTKKAARYVLEQPADVALYSMREVAKRAGVPPGTLLRLSAALDFDSYNALREVYRRGVQQSQDARVFSGRARHLQRTGRARSTAQLLAAVRAAEAEGLEKTFAANEPAAVERVAKLLERAERLFVLGQRSCYPAAYFFDYVLRLLRPTSRLVDGRGGALVDDLRDIGAGDVLVAISIEPYTAEVVRAAEFAARQGAKVVAITDSRVSPLRKSAAETLLAASRSASFFHSILPLLALVQGLIALLAARGGDKALAALADAEEQLEWFHVYWPGGANGRRG
ncbi:MAG TPA: MurR/RpiR family transcriptional regulator [Ramlibacter sp.]|nr:MurR/RpiR family transcriptional regulator [Ramlibacter sp.]